MPTHACALGRSHWGMGLHFEWHTCGFIRFAVVVVFNCFLLFIKERLNQLDQTASFCVQWQTLWEITFSKWACIVKQVPTEGTYSKWESGLWRQQLSGVSERPARGCPSVWYLVHRVEERHAVHSSRCEGMQLWILKLRTHTHFIYMYVCMYENMKLVCQNVCV